VDLTRDEIIQYASRYIAAGDIGDFPVDGDLFCLFWRTTDSNGGTARESRWEFGGYGICRGYRLDEDVKPEGKWVWFEFVSLATFPPHVTALKLQPPHVVTGTFSAHDRSREMRVVKVSPAGKVPAASVGQQNAGAGDALPDNVLRFPATRTRKPARRRRT
jgi:hypothetical protein